MLEQPKPIRAFIAIELSETVKQELEALQQRLRVGPAEGIKWVNPKSIHVTLKFLGWVAPDRIEGIKSAIFDAVSGFTPFDLRVNGLGAFPNMRRMNVIWSGLSGELNQLTGLQQSIEKHVSPLGFPTEQRAFSPHLTLARLRDEVSPEVKQKLADKLPETTLAPDLTIHVDSVNLMQSTLLPAGAIYTYLASFPLKGS